MKKRSFFKGIAAASIPLIMGVYGYTLSQKNSAQDSLHQQDRIEDGFKSQTPDTSEGQTTNRVEDEDGTEEENSCESYMIALDKQKEKWVAGITNFLKNKKGLFILKDREDDVDFVLLMGKDGKIEDILNRESVADILVIGKDKQKLSFSEQILEQLNIPSLESNKKWREQKALHYAKAAQRSVLDNIFVFTALTMPNIASEEEFFSVTSNGSTAKSGGFISYFSQPPRGLSWGEFSLFEHGIDLKTLGKYISITRDENFHYQVDLKELVSSLKEDHLLKKSKDFREAFKKGPLVFSRDEMLQRTKKLGIQSKIEKAFEKIDKKLSREILFGRIKFPEVPFKGDQDKKPFQDWTRKQPKRKIL